jgi:rhodanese-related sulfurtransferase
MDRETSALDGGAVSAASRHRVHHALAVVAVTLGALAAIAGDPPAGLVSRDGRARDGAIGAGVAAIADAIAAEKDHVTPGELAEWIRDQRDGLRVVDVRSSKDLDGPLIPTAERIELTALPKAAFGAGDIVVLYSAEGVHAGQAWVLLRALGVRDVFFLSGGWAAWHDEIMHPTLEEGAPADAQSAFARTAELSRYFGGTPRIVPSRRRGKDEDPLPPRETPTSPSPRRRGC